LKSKSDFLSYNIFIYSFIFSSQYITALYLKLPEVTVLEGRDFESVDLFTSWNILLCNSTMKIFFLWERITRNSCGWGIPYSGCPWTPPTQPPARTSMGGNYVWWLLEQLVITPSSSLYSVSFTLSFFVIKNIDFKAN